MKIKITKPLPMAEQYQPPVGSVYEVNEVKPYPEYNTKAYIIEYNNCRICVFPEECEVQEG